MLSLCVCGVWVSAAQPQVLAVALSGPEWGWLGQQWANIGRFAADPRMRYLVPEELRYARHSLNTRVYIRKDRDLDRRLRESRNRPDEVRLPLIRQIFAERDVLDAAHDADMEEFRQLVEILKARRDARQREIAPMRPGRPK